MHKIATLCLGLAGFFVNHSIIAQGTLSQSVLIEDSRQMLSLLESVHPQPYMKSGGKIAFHRRYQNVLNAIPDNGMSREDFRGLLSPLVAAVGDGHTYVYPDGPFDFAGIPLLFYVVQKDLYVSAVLEEGHRQFIGARLRAVQGVGMDELVRRTRAYYGADNVYGTLVQLANFELFLAKKAVLEDLVPEWQDTSRVNILIQLPDGELREVALPTRPRPNTRFLRPQDRLALPQLNGLEFGWGFLNDRKTVAYLRVLRMTKNRETYEKRATYSDVSEEVFDFHRSIYKNGEDPTFEEALSALPSLTESLVGLFEQMRSAKSTSLIVDLRTNVGGWALPADILIYFLYGKDALIDVHRRVNIATRKLSPEYLDDDPDQSLDELNNIAISRGRRDYLLTETDYDFSDPNMLVGGRLPKSYARQLVEDDLALSPTFFAEYQAGIHSAYHVPQNVIVLTDSATFSAGFMLAQYLKLLGATVVGNVPSQNIGQMGETLSYQLQHSRLSGTISRSFLVHNAGMTNSNAAESVLRPDHELTYEKLKEYGFSRSSAVEYALEIIEMRQSGTRSED
jgi:hypothetical protein